MAHVWLREAGGWQADKLGASAYCLGLREAGAESGPAMPQIIRTGPGPQAWALISAPGSGVRVNGRSLVAGIRILSDHDEIQAGGAQFFFSAESPAVIEGFTALDRPVFCARCRQPIDAGSPAVRCPGARCAIWYHQTAELPCWTYAESCGVCGQRTALDAGFGWMPEE